MNPSDIFSGALAQARPGVHAATAGPAAPATTATQGSQTFALAKAGDVASDLAVNLVVAVLILVVTLWASRWASKLVRLALGRFKRTAHDTTIQDFAGSLVRYLVIIIGGVAVLRRLGVETASIITMLGAASLAIGLALQGALSNVAAGVMIVMFRPYRVGDYVTIAGKSGTVSHLDLFNTEVHDVDGLKLTVPNGKAFGDVVTNYTDIPRRRFELVIGIGYDDDPDLACEVLKRVAAEDERILKDPAPWAAVVELAASTVNVSLRVWAPVEDYWAARYDLTKRAKLAFDAARISMPFPTTTIVRNEDPASLPGRLPENAPVTSGGRAPAPQTRN